jgi:hypothetical protein
MRLYTPVGIYGDASVGGRVLAIVRPDNDYHHWARDGVGYLVSAKIINCPCTHAGWLGYELPT